MELKDGFVEVKLDLGVKVVDHNVGMALPLEIVRPPTGRKQLVALDASTARVIPDKHDPSSEIAIAEPDLVAGEKPQAVVSDIELIIAAAWVMASEGHIRDIFLDERVPKNIG
jgi:hypothetical protein